jgi:flagellar biosynthesis anti-sigma factor FlgM
MKIDPIILIPTGQAPQPTQVKNSRSSGVQTGQSAANSVGTKPAAGEDTVNISSTLSDLYTLSASFASVPEVRVGLVSALQQRVNSGQYKPDSQKIADAIIAEHFSHSAKA